MNGTVRESTSTEKRKMSWASLDLRLCVVGARVREKNSDSSTNKNTCLLAKMFMSVNTGWNYYHEGRTFFFFFQNNHEHPIATRSLEISRKKETPVLFWARTFPVWQVLAGASECLTRSTVVKVSPFELECELLPIKKILQPSQRLLRALFISMTERT